MYRLLAALVSVVICGRAGIAAAQPGDDPARPPSVYATAVRRALDSTWRPDDVFRAHRHGRALGPWTVELRIAVAADGAVRDVVVESSSGLRAFDDEAVRAVRALQPFPAPPAELVDPASSTFTFAFALGHPGWAPPPFTGDPLVRTPQTRSWELGSSVDHERRGNALRGSSAIAERASYDRTTVTMTAAHHVDAIGLVELQLPVSTIRYREPSSGTRTEVTGLGDASLHLHRDRRAGRWSSGYFFGLRLPTGEAAAMPRVGTALPTVVQLGAGTLDPEFGACMNLQLRDTTSLAACDHGRIAVYSNAHGYRDAYEFHARLLVTTSLLARHASVQAGVLYETRSAAHLNGEELPSTGHHALFAEASAWVVVFRGLSVRATLELPLYERVSGMQLADTLRVMTGLSYDFDRR